MVMSFSKPRGDEGSSVGVRSDRVTIITANGTFCTDYPLVVGCPVFLPVGKACSLISGIGWGRRKVERKFVVLSIGHAAFEVFPADRLVGLVATDLDLCSLFDNAALIVESQHHGGFASTVADGLDFNQVVGPGEQVLASFKQLTPKIGSQAVAENRDSEVVGDIPKLVHLFASEKLGFINKKTVQRLFTMSVADKR